MSDNSRHRASVPFDERSLGFVWFFSFLAYFAELEEAAEQDLILLLDEPGLSLHGRAQDDLLRLIDERLVLKDQVVYTTHSPFMVSADHLQRVRTFIDQDDAGSKVSAEIFRADEDTAFPLYAAGIEMTQSLFIGEHTAGQMMGPRRATTGTRIPPSRAPCSPARSGTSARRGFARRR